MTKQFQPIVLSTKLSFTFAAVFAAGIVSAQTWPMPPATHGNELLAAKLVEVIETEHPSLFARH